MVLPFVSPVGERGTGRDIKLVDEDNSSHGRGIGTERDFYHTLNRSDHCQIMARIRQLHTCLQEGEKRERNQDNVMLFLLLTHYQYLKS